MRVNFLKFSFLMTFLMVFASACEKDTPTPEPPAAEFSPLVMTYEDFITPDDVQIVSPDSTYISVSSAYVKKMGIENFKNRPVTIWRTIGTVPFVRIITDSKEENGQVILTTTRGEFCDMFSNLEMSIETDLYVDNDAPTRATRAGTNEEVDDVSEKYIDEEGVHHPAVIILDENSPITRSIQTRAGEVKNYYTAEELLESNIAFDIINLNSDFEIDLAYPQESDDDDDDDDDDDGGPSVHFKGKVGVNAKLSAYANINVSWFKLKMFETGVKGSVGASAKLSLSIENEIEKKWEKKLASLGKTTMVYWVGIVPIPFTLENSLMQRTKASASASAELLATGKYQLEFEKGCKYVSGFGWVDTSKESKTTKSFNFDGLKGSASLEAGTGTFYEVGFYLAGSVGPKMSFGPSISAEAEVSATVLPEGVTVEANVGAYASLSGSVGAKVKVLGYTLAKWETTYDVFKATLYEGSLTWSFTEDSWNELETEWTNLMEQNSAQWAPQYPATPYPVRDGKSLYFKK